MPIATLTTTIRIHHGEKSSYSLPTKEIGIHDSPSTVHPYTRCLICHWEGSSPLLSLSLTKNRMRSLQALSQKVLKLYLAIDSSIVEICDRSLCSRGLGLCSLESDRRGVARPALVDNHHLDSTKLLLVAY